MPKNNGYQFSLLINNRKYCPPYKYAYLNRVNDTDPYHQIEDPVLTMGNIHQSCGSGMRLKRSGSDLNIDSSIVPSEAAKKLFFFRG